MFLFLWVYFSLYCPREIWQFGIFSAILASLSEVPAPQSEDFCICNQHDNSSWQIGHNRLFSLEVSKALKGLKVFRGLFEGEQAYVRTEGFISFTFTVIQIVIRNLVQVLCISFCNPQVQYMAYCSYASTILLLTFTKVVRHYQTTRQLLKS